MKLSGETQPTGKSTGEERKIEGEVESSKVEGDKMMFTIKHAGLKIPNEVAESERADAERWAVVRSKTCTKTAGDCQRQNDRSMLSRSLMDRSANYVDEEGQSRGGFVRGGSGLVERDIYHIDRVRFKERTRRDSEDVINGRCVLGECNERA
ncbi:hypothetical protein L6452_37553 [Arctium lappa]|uniref:Uncharacterized protein n=1 Tax=Arctium lappa TaxID=4217 RepID=A0ACB8Y2N0_ARCLA|nr:hypothetical protein L6452_37553 [Arctium lappa]